MLDLIPKVNHYFLKKDQERDKRDKTSFWPSETATDVFDLYHKWTGTKVTDPVDSETMAMFQVGNLIEQAYVNIFDELNILKGGQVRIEMERFGINVTGYIDCIIYNTDDTSKIKLSKDLAKKIGNQVTKEELLELTGNSLEIIPVEIKSFYGDWQDKDLQNGNVKENYVAQLSIYLDYLDLKEGILFYINRGRGQTYQFKVKKISEWKYKCNDMVVDLEKIYKRWSRLYKNNILKKIEPKPEYTYKYDIDKLNWKEQKPSAISNARNNHKVIGDWQAMYSSYFQLHLKYEKTQRGYTDKEIEKIKEKTKGYSTWKK